MLSSRNVRMSESDEQRRKLFFFNRFMLPETSAPSFKAEVDLFIPAVSLCDVLWF